jgi:hypothetical protein
VRGRSCLNRVTIDCFGIRGSVLQLVSIVGERRQLGKAQGSLASLCDTSGGVRGVQLDGGAWVVIRVPSNRGDGGRASARDAQRAGASGDRHGVLPHRRAWRRCALWVGVAAPLTV